MAGTAARLLRRFRGATTNAMSDPLRNSMARVRRTPAPGSDGTLSRGLHLVFDQDPIAPE